MDAPLQQKAATLPQKPGVYLFKNEQSAILYVGKADNLKSRVQQYISGTDTRFMILFLYPVHTMWMSFSRPPRKKRFYWSARSFENINQGSTRNLEMTATGYIYASIRRRSGQG